MQEFSHINVLDLPQLEKESLQNNITLHNSPEPWPSSLNNRLHPVVIFMCLFKI